MGRTRMTIAVAVLALTLAACDGGEGEGDDGGTTAATGGTTTGATAETGGTGATGGGDTITISGFAFEPSTLEVAGPTEVTIVNEDSAAHTFTLDDGSVDEELGGGDSVTVTIDVSESTGFVCEFHPQMTGTIEVA